MLDLYVRANIDDRVAVPGITRVTHEFSINPFDHNIFWLFFGRIFGKKNAEALSRSDDPHTVLFLKQLRETESWQEFRSIYFEVIHITDVVLEQNASVFAKKMKKEIGQVDARVFRRVWLEQKRQLLSVVFGVVATICTGGLLFLIGLISRYHPSKGHQNFLRAAVQLVEDCPEVHFVLAGRGVDQHNKNLTKSIHELCLESRVHLLGERTDTPRVTAALDLAVSSSFSEGFPNSIGEAMACGVPCVATDVGDSARIVEDTGAIVPPGDHRALAAAWKHLLEIGPEGRQELGAAARNRIKERFNLPAMVTQYEELYRQLIC